MSKHIIPFIIIDTPTPALFRLTVALLKDVGLDPRFFEGASSSSIGNRSTNDGRVDAGQNGRSWYTGYRASIFYKDTHLRFNAATQMGELAEYLVAATKAPVIKDFYLNDKHSATVESADWVKVGCQSFSVNRILALADEIRRVFPEADKK